jgi:hypothetical protein
MRACYRCTNSKPTAITINTKKNSAPVYPSAFNLVEKAALELVAGGILAPFDEVPDDEVVIVAGTL